MSVGYDAAVTTRTVDTHIKSASGRSLERLASTSKPFVVLVTVSRVYRLKQPSTSKSARLSRLDKRAFFVNPRGFDRPVHDRATPGKPEPNALPWRLAAYPVEGDLLLTASLIKSGIAAWRLCCHSV